jgi:hypothetical protein
MTITSAIGPAGDSFDAARSFPEAFQPGDSVFEGQCEFGKVIMAEAEDGFELNSDSLTRHSFFAFFCL